MSQEFIDNPYDQAVGKDYTPDDIYAQGMQEERVRNIIAQISPDTQLGEIELRIRGYRKDTLTGEWKVIDKDSKEVSPKLVSRYISYLGSILNQNTSMSNLNSVQVNKIMKLVIEYLSDDMDANAEEYGFAEEYTERTRIGHIILNSTFMVLNRALNGSEARRIWKALSLTESYNPSNESRSKGWLGALKEAVRS